MLLGIGAIVALCGVFVLAVLLSEVLVVVGGIGLMFGVVVGAGSLVQGHEPPHYVVVVVLAACGCAFVGVLGSDDF